jgi:NurA domain
MPFQGEYATGESLLSLQQSRAFREFKGRVRPRPSGPPVAPTILDVPRNGWTPRRVVAVDGSTISEALDNGFPMAEATLMKVAVVSIDLSKLAIASQGDIPSPRVFYDMENASTFDCVLPGANIDRPDIEGDTPLRFFRHSAFDAFSGRLDGKHETLIETVRAVVGGPHEPARAPRCPVEDCPHDLAPGIGAYRCCCERNEALFETDAFRFAERFSEVSSNGEAHGEVRHVLEIVSLINMLRFFAADVGRLRYLRDNVFIVDGPLALFGHPAWLTPHLRRELQRINSLCRAQGFELAVFGYEKSGAFVEHFERLDTSPDRGPRSLHPARTAFGLDAAYINRNITLRPADAKPHGQDTYFGRKVFYKTAAGEHAVITTAMTTAASSDFRRSELACYPRLGDMLNVLDQLATYLHRDGFMPLVRAHAHAAIPLKRGADIIRSLFGN